MVTRIPFDLGNDTASLVSRRRPIFEVFEKSFDLGQRRPAHGPLLPVRDLLAQDVVGG